MKRLYLIANWKMNKTAADASAFCKEFSHEWAQEKEKTVVICPSFTALAKVCEEIEESGIKIGAQDLFYEDQGPFTGEISAAMLREFNVSYVIVGHSERRRILMEPDELANKKAKAALRSKIIPVICVGESLEERNAGKMKSVVERQLKTALEGISEADARNILVAYEPVWAIGTGNNAAPAQAEEMHAFIRAVLEKIFSKDLSKKVPILYGGSVKPDNIEMMTKQQNIDGALVGGASLDPKNFAQLVKNA
ncbi:triose-phosphate isomerase [Candidatus Woesearchaeota archaeon]|nr:triose-phosphate isomerase [Candidatus Woesearchaeota archaeon]